VNVTSKTIGGKEEREAFVNLIIETIRAKTGIMKLFVNVTKEFRFSIFYKD
jgi:hypothetical protein